MVNKLKVEWYSVLSQQHDLSISVRYKMEVGNFLIAQWEVSEWFPEKIVILTPTSFWPSRYQLLTQTKTYKCKITYDSYKMTL